MRNHDHLQRIYTDAPAHVLATMTAGALARCDTSEIARIGDALLDKSRSSTERLRQVLRRGELTQMGLAWALDCWQTYGAIMEFTMAAQPPNDDMPYDKLSVIAEFMRRAMNAKLASLIAAQREICQHNGMAFDDMRRLANLDAMGLRDEETSRFPISSKNWSSSMVFSSRRSESRSKPRNGSAPDNRRCIQGAV